MSDHLVIVGGGQAAAQAVQSLRQQSFAGAITLLSDEPYPPYQRPPLSKKYFAGELARERLMLRPAAFYAEKGVALELGARVEELDAVYATRSPTFRCSTLGPTAVTTPAPSPPSPLGNVSG